MDPKLILETVGYIGSAFVVISMLMTSVVKLRLINMIGSIISIVYASIVHAYPLALMNLCLVVINFINLVRLLKGKKQFTVVKVNPEEAYTKHFRAEHIDDIKKFFPDADSVKSERTYLIFCNSAPAGILEGNVTDSTLSINIDYATPMFRDCSVGKFIYSYLANEGIKMLCTTSSCSTHRSYLKKMDFTESENGFIKKL